MKLGFFAPGHNVSAWRMAFEEAYPEIEFKAWLKSGDYSDVDYVLVWNPTADVFSGCKTLKGIFSLGAGVDHLLRIKHTLPKKVPIVRMADPGLVAFMSSFVVMSVLFHHRNMVAYRLQQKKTHWQALDSVSARQCRVGFMGAGNMASKPATVLTDMGHPVLTWSRSQKNDPGMISYWGPEQLPEFLSQTNVLVSLLPSTPDTTGLLNHDTLSMLPQDAAVINVGRGNVLVTDDLIRLLDAGKLSGATLDVFDEEPLPTTSPVWTHEKIIVTPHIASPSLPRSVAEYTVQVIRDFENGQGFPNVVDLELGY